MKYHLLPFGKLFHSIAHSQVNGESFMVRFQPCCICIVGIDQICLYQKRCSAVSQLEALINSNSGANPTLQQVNCHYKVSNADKHHACRSLRMGPCLWCYPLMQLLQSRRGT